MVTCIPIVEYSFGIHFRLFYSMKIMLLGLILFLTFFSYGQPQQSPDVIGCGGFIKSETDINYKVVRVNIFS